MNGLAYSQESSHSHLNEPLLAPVQVVEENDDESHLEMRRHDQSDIFSSRKNQFIVVLLIIVLSLVALIAKSANN